MLSFLNKETQLVNL